MTKQDRNDLRNEAKNGGLDAAIFRKLGCVKEAKAAGNKCPVGWEAAYYGIKDEVERTPTTIRTKHRPAANKIRRHNYGITQSDVFFGQYRHGGSDAENG